MIGVVLLAIEVAIIPPLLRACPSVEDRPLVERVLHGMVEVVERTALLEVLQIEVLRLFVALSMSVLVDIC